MSILKDLKILVRAICVFLFVFLFHRALFWFSFSNQRLDNFSVGGASSFEVLNSWWLGFRFDLRVISAFFLAFLILSFVLRWIFKFIYKPERFLFPLQVGLMVLGLYGFLIIFWIDFGYYSYLSERLSSKIFALISTPGIAWGMVSASYPLFLIVPAFILCSILIFLSVFKLIFLGNSKNLIFSSYRKYGISDIFVGFIAFLLIAFGIYSNTSRYSLRWSEAYFSRINFINQFGLNPLHNVFDTYKFSQITYTDEEISEDVELVKKDLGISESQGPLLVRNLDLHPLFKTPPNVVVIMMESLASFKVGSYGAPLNTTPYLDEIISDSLLFDNFHVNQISTAASIFSFVTGIPDLNEEETASRNPLVVDQHTIINNFKDYKKYYFIGGDSNWGNISGILVNNISSLNLIEGKNFGLEKVNVWGISDLELFEEAHKTFKSQNNERFFAFIQTAGYHDPYSMPKRMEGFKEIPLSEELVKKYGFHSQEEYNSLRFFDHALKYFFKLAKSSDYYKNTLFVMYADHGQVHLGQSQLSSFYKEHGLSGYHIPLVFHSVLLPKELKGKRNSTLGHAPDILPTIQSMIGIKGVNSGIGVDLLSKKALNRKGVFLRGTGALPIKFFDGKRMVYTGVDSKSEIKSYKTENFIKQLQAIKIGSKFLNEEEEINDEVRGLALLGRAYFKTIKFKMRNNQKERIYRFKKPSGVQR